MYVPTWCRVRTNTNAPDQGVGIVGVDPPEHGFVRVVHALALRVCVDVHREEIALRGVRLDHRNVPSFFLCVSRSVAKKANDRTATKENGHETVHERNKNSITVEVPSFYVLRSIEKKKKANGTIKKNGAQ